MKKFLLTLALVAGLGVVANAGDIVSIESWPNSDYGVAHSTISISSTTTTCVEAHNRWREVYLGDPDTTVDIFYRADGSTDDVPTVGWWIPAGQGQKIELNAQVCLQLGAGASAVTIRQTLILK